MADTSYRFGTDSDDNQLSPDETDCLEIEEEYDALNEETFGTLEDSCGIDDWEQQHEQFAELAQNSKQTVSLDNSVSNLKLEESSYVFPTINNVWSYNATPNGEVFSNSLLPNAQKAPKTSGNIGDISNSSDDPLALFNVSATKFDSPLGGLTNHAQKICTVEELERGLLQTRTKAQAQSSLTNSMPSLHHVQLKVHPPFLQHPIQEVGSGRLPPGLPPIGVPPPHMRFVHHMHHRNMYPALVRLMPPKQFGPPGGPTPPPSIYYPRLPIPVNQSFFFPSPPRIGNMHNMPHNKINHHNNQHPRNKMDENSNRHRNEYFAQKDEYAGLVTNREKQWLINIQLVQLNTGTPYFDDYYYTIFKERKSKNSKENQPPLEKGLWHNRRSNDRQENQNTLTPKVYTPLQFENSLGKVQCGSVTAPRKIIDMDIVTPEKDNENSSISTRDTKKIKQLLLELEAFYCYLLKAEDLKNPMYKSNMVKLCEIKQKQRLRELDMASTPEQKQEILKCLQQESAPLNENSRDYLTKVISGLFQEDKYSNFLGIRKGKMLLLRVLPNLTIDYFSTQLCDIWTKVLLSIPVVGRRDTAGDQLFLRLYPHFKQFILVSDMNVIIEIVSNLLELLGPENNRGTPFSCVGKPPLNFIVANKFGISALAVILMRVETLITENKTVEKQQTEWSNFVVGWAETLLVPKLALVTPIEFVPSDVFDQHCNRINSLSLERMKLLEKWITIES
ncbi:hypothetical protein FQA39_LY10885 [Lamprigera yunnana]|nr:hypothetical protein FQA39_LY10885 [Lamprigera yunnana]